MSTVLEKIPSADCYRDSFDTSRVMAVRTSLCIRLSVSIRFYQDALSIGMISFGSNTPLFMHSSSEPLPKHHRATVCSVTSTRMIRSLQFTDCETQQLH